MTILVAADIINSQTKIVLINEEPKILAMSIPLEICLSKDPTLRIMKEERHSC